jgi:hypothetical protein
VKLRTVIASFSLLLAPLLAVHAHVNAGGLTPLPMMQWNGFRLADAAMAGTKLEEAEGRLSVAVAPESVDWAKRAYAREPFATDSLFVLAMAQTAAGRDPKPILLASQELERRNRFVAVALLQEAANEGDLQAMLGLVDSLVRLRPAARGMFVRAFSGALRDANALPVMAEALSKNPPWAEAFWSAAPREEPALTHFLALRQQTSVGTTDASDASLLQTLVAAGKYETALDLWAELTGRDDPGLAFSNSTLHAPIGWRLAKGGNVNAHWEAEGRITAFIEAGTGGELSRQLVALDPGRYRFSARVASEEQAELRAELECASGAGSKQWRSIVWSEGAREAVWDVPGGACPHMWLVLRGSALDSPVAARTQLSELRFEKIG